MDIKNLEVLYDDNHLIAVNKPAGMLVQEDGDGSMPLDELVKAWIKDKYDKPGAVFLGVIHRLDRPVSGVVIFARTSKALARMNAQFKERVSKKTYLAIVCNEPRQKQERLVHYLGRNSQKNMAILHHNPTTDAKESILTYTYFGKGDKYFYVKVDLETGRHHQIRAQLKAIGCSIKGDLKYGAARSNPGKDISLHAYQLTIEHPVKKDPITITASLPKDPIWQHLKTKLK